MIYRIHGLPVPRIWGSLSGENGETIGEVWWVYHDSSGSSRLTDPDSGGTTDIADLVKRGRLPGNPYYPVLLKTLHTADRLSVQVHPGIDGGDLCKEETWIVLGAEPSSWMLGGFTQHVSPGELRNAIDSGKVEGFLKKIPLQVGDVMHLPPGTIHALGGGLTILEIQRNCNVTYRLYDWERKAIDGRPRELHLEKSLEAINWETDGRPVPAEGFPEDVFRRAMYSVRSVTGPGMIDLPPASILFQADGRVETMSCAIVDNEGCRRDLQKHTDGWVVSVQ